MRLRTRNSMLALQLKANKTKAAIESEANADDHGLLRAEMQEVLDAIWGLDSRIDRACQADPKGPR